MKLAKPCCDLSACKAYKGGDDHAVQSTGTISYTYLVAFVAVEQPAAKVTGLAGRAAYVL